MFKYERKKEGIIIYIRGAMVNALGYGIVVIEFELQSRSLSAKYSWERDEPPYELNSCASRRMDLVLNVTMSVSG